MGSSYRICAVNDTRWDVLRGASDEPVATFTDKHAALAHAMSLARAPSDWQLAARAATARSCGSIFKSTSNSRMIANLASAECAADASSHTLRRVAAESPTRPC